MRIAIDCYGTLLSPSYQPQLLVFIENALNKGHQITIWSSVSGYLGDAARILNAAQIKGRERIVMTTKVEKGALGEDQHPWDVAIDDAPADHLAALHVFHPSKLETVPL